MTATVYARSHREEFSVGVGTNLDDAILKSSGSEALYFGYVEAARWDSTNFAPTSMGCWSSQKTYRSKTRFEGPLTAEVNHRD